MKDEVYRKGIVREGVVREGVVSGVECASKGLGGEGL